MSPLTRILIVAACSVTGYSVEAWIMMMSSVQPAEARERGIPVPPQDATSRTKPQAPLQRTMVTEWERVRSSHGDSPGRFQALYLEVNALNDGFRRRAFRAALIAEWATADPDAALAFLQLNDRGSITQLAREWLRSDPDGAVTGLLGGGEKTRGNLRELLSDIARAAPARLAEVVTSLPKANNRWDTSTQDAFALASQHDLGMTRAAALSVSGPMRGQAIAGVAKAWAEKNGAEALAWVQALPSGEERDAVMKATLLGWSKADPAAALNNLDLVPPGADEGYHASDIGAQVLREAAKQDWDKTIDWLRDHPGKLGRQSFDGLQSAFCERLAADTAGTLSAIEQSGVAALQQVFGNAVLNQGYAQRDKIWEWLDSKPSSDFTREARESIFNAIASKEPDKALEYLDKLPETPEGDAFLASGASRLLNEDDEIARFHQLLEQATPRVRPLLIASAFQHGVSSATSGIDPAGLVEFLHEVPADRRHGAITSLSSGWSRLDPTAALAWARSLPDQAQREHATRTAVRSWAASDPDEAAQWVSALPVGTPRDHASASLVETLMHTQPESAWTWAQNIGSGPDRKRALEIAFQGLVERDPAVAQQMLQRGNLTPAEQQTLQSEFQRMIMEMSEGPMTRQ